MRKGRHPSRQLGTEDDSSDGLPAPSPWLPACLGIIGIGISVMVSHRFGYLLFWAGAAATVSGMGLALAGEIGYRRQQAGRPR